MFFRHNLFGILWAILILILSIMPGRDLPEVNIVQIDKLVHMSFYLILTVLLVRGFFKQYTFPFLKNHAINVVVLIGVLYGIIIEIIQGAFTADRHFDLWDAFANSIGVMIGVIIFKSKVAAKFLK